MCTDAADGGVAAGLGADWKQDTRKRRQLTTVVELVIPQFNTLIDWLSQVSGTDLDPICKAEVAGSIPAVP
ncbi:MAG: hypothetical protein ACRDZ4_23660 [Egibacteraceae bacterium]